MSSSYLPSGVLVNCTFMTKTTPNHLGVNYDKASPFNKHSNAVLLDKYDRKIDQTFMCKSPAKFFGGLAALCAGIALAALAAIAIAAVTVGTGGIGGAILLGVLITSGAGAVAFTGVGLYKQSHPCDCTLTSDWLLFHPSVKFINNTNINNNNAILKSSYLKCSVGGIVQPFINPVIANAVAGKIAANNNSEINWQVGSQLAIGFIGAIAAIDPFDAKKGELGTAGTGIGMGVFGVFAVKEYYRDEGNKTSTNIFGQKASGQEVGQSEISDHWLDKPSEEEKESPNLVDLGVDNTVGGAGGTGGGEAVRVLETNSEYQQQAAQWARKALVRQATNAPAESIASAQLASDIFSRQSTKFAFSWKSFGKGAAFGAIAALINFKITENMHEEEGKKLSDTLNAMKDARESDSQNNIGVVAQQS